MSCISEEEAAELLRTFDAKFAKAGKSAIEVEMSEAFNLSVLNSLWLMLAGIRYNPEEKELSSLQVLLTDLFANIDMCGCLFSQFPILQYLAPEISGYNKFIHIHREIWKFLKVSK